MNATGLAALGSVVAMIVVLLWGGVQLATGGVAMTLMPVMIGALFIIHAALAAVLSPTAGLTTDLRDSLPAPGVLALGPAPIYAIAWLSGAIDLRQAITEPGIVFGLSMVLLLAGYLLRVSVPHRFSDLGATLVSAATLLVLGQAL